MTVAALLRESPGAARSVAVSGFVPRQPTEEGTDERLLTELERGNGRAFRTIHRRYERRLRALALGLTRNEQDASEVVQEAFLRVVSHGARFARRSALYTWLYRIVFNLSMDRLRGASRRYLPLETIEMAGSDTSVFGARSGPDPFDSYANKELGRQLEHSLRQLSRIHQDVIVMRELCGMSYAEMALVSGCSKGTIMSRLFHARQRLQASLRCLYEEAKDSDSSRHS